MKNTVALLFLTAVWQGIISTEPSQNDNKSSASKNKKFVATSEWQKVEKGQPLPAGLHYRVNIYSGETEAKLLESETGNRREIRTGLVALPSDKIDSEGEGSLYLSKDELKKVLADITADDTSLDPKDYRSLASKEKKKFRSYEELKKEMGAVNLTVKTDMELLYNLVNTGRNILTDIDHSDIVTTLRDLEYLVHQIDNAREFIRLGGLPHIIIPALNSTSPEVRAEALWLLGSAAQSNPKVQIAILNAGVMPILVKAAVLDSNAVVQARAMYGLSCITRQFPAAQAKLVTEGGLELLSSIIDDKHADFKLKMKVITLINDLLLEHTLVGQAVEEIEKLDYTSDAEAVQKIQQHKLKELKEKLRQYNAVQLGKRLFEDRWCNRLSEFLWALYESGAISGRAQRRDDLGSVVSQDVPYRPEHDSVEKVVGAIYVIKDFCQDEFQSDQKLEEALQNFFLWYQELSIREELLQKQSIKVECVDGSENCQKNADSDDNVMYYSTLAETLRELLKFIEQNKAVHSGLKDEL